MNALIEEYKQSRKLLHTAEKNENDTPHINAMVTNIDYAIHWMETGRRPGNKRGIERRASYQRDIPIDPQIIQAMVRNRDTEYRRMSDNDYNRLLQVMAILSRRERECFEMHVVGQLNEYDIADELGIKRETVREYLERAEKKISNFIKKPMQTALDIVI